MKVFLYKLKFIFSNPLSIIWKIFRNFSSIIGFVTTIFTILDTIIKDNKHIVFLCENVLYFFIGTLVIALILSVKWIPSITYKINETDSYLSIKVGDITEEKKSIIISTNTSFITTMKDDIISEKSAQGAFQKKFYKDSLDELDKKIADGLTQFVSRSNLVLNNSRKKYPVYDVGTVSKIRQNNRNVYFLALNDINSVGQNENRMELDFYTALSGLWEFIKKMGNTEDASIHLIASGRSGLNITKEESLKEIIKSYIGQSQNYKLLTKLTIYIYPTDLKYINIKRVKKFVENQCMFAETNNNKGKGEK